MQSEKKSLLNYNKLLHKLDVSLTVQRH